MATYRDLFYREPYPPMGPPYDYNPDPMKTYCTGIKPPPPPAYPYINPCVQDTYGHHCYHEMKGYPFPNEFPVNGPMEGSAFTLINYTPYLYDNTHVRYGNLLNMAESVVTRVSRRTDPSCIDLFGTFDLTKGIKKNTIMSDYLCKCISQKYEEMHNYFNLMQAPLLFRLYFSVYDEQNAVVYTNTVSASTPDLYFHFTDIRDFYIESAKSIFMTNIPAMDYSGIYRLHLDKLDVYGSIINTYDHIVDANPYYAFASNNEKLELQHDVISNTMPDASILLASSPIDQDIPFQANLTTRLKFNFTAFLSDLIAIPNTACVYSAMFEPTDQKISNISAEVQGIKESIATINATLLQLQDTLNEVRTQVNTNTIDIQSLKDDTAIIRSTVQSNYNELDMRLTTLETRVSRLEAIPLATLSYTEGKEYVRGQLTWTKWGQLYQVCKAFTASGNITTDISMGCLVPLSVDGNVEMQSVEARIQNNAAAIDTITGIVTTHTTDITNLKSDMTQAQTDITNAQTSIGALELTVNGNNDDVVGLSETVNTLDSTLNTLSTTVGTLDTTVTSLNTQVGTLDVTVNGDATHDGLTTSVSALSTQVGDLNGSTVTKLTQEEYDALDVKTGIYMITD